MDKAMTMGIGALGGGLVAFLVWQVMKAQVDNQVTATIDREVPIQVRAELDRKFQSLGITPTMAGQVRTLMTNLDQLGVLGALASGSTVPRS